MSNYYTLLKKMSRGILCTTCGGTTETGNGHRYGCVSFRYDLGIADNPDLVKFDAWMDSWYKND